MKRTRWFLGTCLVGIVAGSLICLAAGSGGGKKKILFYSQSSGYRHAVVARPLTGEISHAEKVFKEIATKAGYDVYLSQDYHDLDNEGKIKKFDAIVLYTTLSPRINRDALLKWVRDGGTLIGVHCATDSFYDWKEYGKMMGGYFKRHGCTHKDVHIKVENTKHPATRMLGKEWVIHDEIYQFREDSFSRDNVATLMSIDTEATPEANLTREFHNMERGKDYPVSWTNTEGKGRVFYTSLGHRADVWTNPKFQQHLMGGIAWALGQAKEGS